MKKVIKVIVVVVIVAVCGIIHEQIMSIPKYIQIMNMKYKGIWTSIESSNQKKIDEGYLVEWKPDYYAAHDYTDYGKSILALRKGDKVRINGKTVEIEGSVVGFKHETVEEIESKVNGNNHVFFQTCCRLLPDVYHIKYGRYVSD